MSPVAAPWVRVHALLPALSAYTLGCAPHTPLLAVLAATTAVRTCSLRNLREGSRANLATEVYAVVQTLVIAEVYAYHMPVAGWVCLVHLVTAEVCAFGSLEIVDSVPTAVVDRMHTVREHAAVVAYCSANCSEDLQTNAPSVDQGVANVLRGEVEAGKSLGLSPAVVDQGMCFVLSLGDTGHLLW